MTFDWTISAGTVIQVVGLALTAWAVVAAVKNRLDVLQNTLQSHAEALEKHDTMLGKYETRIFDLVGGLQRLVGRFEVLEHQRHGKQ